MDGRAELERIVRCTEWLTTALTAARDVDAPDWLIGAGAIRTAVWDHLHGYQTRTALADIDLVFFDPDDLSREREDTVRGHLEKRLPAEVWDAKNQAAVHLWYPKRFGYPIEPLTSTAAAVATWPETATSVGVRLGQDEDLVIVAPLGLDDLLGLVCRRNPARVSIAEYQRRVDEKRIRQRWPRVTIIPAS
jgi:hypothetical protein